MTWWRCRVCKGPPFEGNDREKPWIGPCPHCGRFCNAERLIGEGVPQNVGLQGITSASSGNAEYEVKRYPTGVEPFDLVLSGGVAKSQCIMFAGGAGSRKSTMGLCSLDGLTKHSKRLMLFISAEENTDGVMRICRLNGIANDQVILHPNDRYENTLEKIIKRLRALRPFAAVIDSLQAVSQISNLNENIVAYRLADYCRQSGMIGIIICQVTAEGNFKGGTGPSHFVDTLVMYEIFKPSVDGDPNKLFGPDATKLIKYNNEMRARDCVEGLRVLVGGANGKNRFGAIDQKAYIYSDKNGEMHHLHTRVEENS